MQVLDLKHCRSFHSELNRRVAIPLCLVYAISVASD
jgi:hypothetical protein